MASATEETLRKAVAEFFEVDEAQVGPGFSFQGRGQSSITRAALDALIRRRVGVKYPAVYSARTYGELIGGAGDGAVETASAAPAPMPPPAAPPGAVRCGVDIELIENLPGADDCWEAPFYRASFHPSEIAYCLMQEAPALHFAARWCAKEALKKCDGSLAGAAMSDLEVVSDGSAPYLVHHAGGVARRLPHALSLSHTPIAAVAVVVHADLAGATTTRAVEVAPPAATGEPAPPAPAPRRGAFTALVALAALVVAVVALLRTIPGVF